MRIIELFEETALSRQVSRQISKNIEDVERQAQQKLDRVKNDLARSVLQRLQSSSRSFVSSFSQVFGAAPELTSAVNQIVNNNQDDLERIVKLTGFFDGLNSGLQQSTQQTQNQSQTFLAVISDLVNSGILSQQEFGDELTTLMTAVQSKMSNVGTNQQNNNQQQAEQQPQNQETT